MTHDGRMFVWEYSSSTQQERDQVKKKEEERNTCKDTPLCYLWHRGQWMSACVFGPLPACLWEWAACARCDLENHWGWQRPCSTSTSPTRPVPTPKGKKTRVRSESEVEIACCCASADLDQTSQPVLFPWGNGSARRARFLHFISLHCILLSACLSRSSHPLYSYLQHVTSFAPLRSSANETAGPFPSCHKPQTAKVSLQLAGAAASRVFM